MTRKERLELIREKGRVAREKTNDSLQEEISVITRLKKSDIARMLPKQADKAALAELIAILNLETTRNNRLNTLKDNIDNVGGVVLRLLEMVI